jgi:NitT/TauT family transport system ATP-binding protein
MVTTNTTTEPGPIEAGAVLLAARSVTKTFESTEGPKAALEDVDLEVRAGEILALLGRSGSGKSTLLRCLAGLLTPSRGMVEYRERPLTTINPGTSMVFQSFALLPWLTAQENVEVGLEARRIPPAERAARALHAIDLVGLDGFESAYPKELSGGMRQRVGFARAIVTEPEVLLMDEPFSALDVLTAENLRGELLEIWERDDIPIEAIVIVTHNIEEAVLLADRVVVLGSNPGHVKATIPVLLPRPRDRRAPEFEGLVDTLYSVMTGRDEVEAVPPPRVDGVPDVRRTPATVPLPHASVDGLSGLAEILEQLGRSTVADVADELVLEVDDLLPLIDALELLGFAEVVDGQLGLTPSGVTFAGADIQASKQIFAAEAQARAPLVGLIANSLGRTDDGTLRRGFFLDVLRRHFSSEEASAQLDIAIDWGRYAELYEYDADHDELRLESDP